MNRNTARILAISSLFVLGFAMDAFSQLAAVGPTNPANGFPLWYEDTPVRPAVPARRLGLCLTDLVCEFDNPIPRNPFSRRIGFGKQAFYWGATADIGRLASLEMGVKTAWAGGVVRNGNQRVMNFIRIDLRQVPDAVYTVVHPFGVETMDLTVPGATGVLVRSVSGRTFRGALNGPVTLFLRGTNPAPGFIGDQRVLQTITGSPNGTNFFRVIGPPGVNLGGNVRQNVVTTTRFLIQGDLLP